MPSFHELELRWGAPTAYHYLTEVERAARIPSHKTMGTDPEKRLADAFRAQDSMSLMDRAA